MVRDMVPEFKVRELSAPTESQSRLGKPKVLTGLPAALGIVAGVLEPSERSYICRHILIWRAFSDNPFEVQESFFVRVDKYSKNRQCGKVRL